MIGQSKVFAISFVAQPQVTFVNDLAALTKESAFIDHAVVMSDSPFVIEAASIHSLSAYESASSTTFADQFNSFENHEESFVDDSLDAWFVFFDSTQPLLTQDQLAQVFANITTEAVWPCSKTQAPRQPAYSALPPSGSTLFLWPQTYSGSTLKPEESYK